MAVQDTRTRAVLDVTAASVRTCTRCRLHESRTHAVPGDGPADAAVLLLGEGPGEEEDASGRPFVGRAGRILDKALEQAGLPRRTVFVTNVVKCRPPGNRTPKAGEMEACRPYLMAQVQAIAPKVVATLGSTALRGLLGPGHELKSARGQVLRFGDIPVVPTYHPAAVLYNRGLEAALLRDLRKVARLARDRRGKIRGGPPRPERPTKAKMSSGAVVIDARGRVLLLRRAEEATWCFPKGTVEPGETLPITALREIREETGLEVRLHRLIHTVQYEYHWPPDDVNYAKTVAYFLAEPMGGDVRLEEGFDAFRWVPRSQALHLLRWKNDREVLEKAFEARKVSKP